MARSNLVVLCLLLAGCGHSEPFAAGTAGSAGACTDVPCRLTFSPGDDRTPSWLPDGSGILYSTEREDRPDHDRCIAELPAEGGAVRRRWCQRAPAHDDSTDVWESASVSPDGRVVFLEVISRIGRQKLGASSLRLGRLEDPAAATALTPVPYAADNGRLHSSVRLIRWLGPAEAVYLGERVIYEGSTFFPDTIITGQDVVHLDLSGAAPVFRTVPGTDYASSVAVSEEPGTIYYTLGGDARVYRRDLASGAVFVAHDFGAAGVARDVQVRGRWLIAVVGGSVLFRDEPANGWVQRDEGGYLHVVDRQTGQETRIELAPVLFRHPEIAPDGSAFVVEVTPYAPVHDTPESDYTALNHRADLWRYPLPLPSP